MLYTTWSRTSDTSSTSSTARVTRLFDFSVRSMPGLYKTSSKHFFLDFHEESATAALALHTRPGVIFSEFCESPIVQSGIEYSAHIKIVHVTGGEFTILIPDCRSYNPAGLDKPYFTSLQYYFIVRLIAVEVKAACLGVSEEKLDMIRSNIEKISIISKNLREIIDWVHLQIKCACYRKTIAPKFFEFLIGKASKNEFLLEGREHCKEYLESCVSGEEIYLPLAYYVGVLEGEAKMQFQKKVSFAEIIRKESKLKRNGGALKYLPKAVPEIVSGKQGKSYAQLVSETERYEITMNSTADITHCAIF